MLRRDLEDFSLLDLYRASRNFLPLGEINEFSEESEWDRVFVRSMQGIEEKGRAELNRSLRALYATVESV